ncbi:unnamed protein product, partial [Choristocarpus tenellus]
LKQIHDAVGRDHWVTTPCERTSLAPGTARHIMEGTRLTIVAKAPEGFEFTIRTPGTPDRWQQYNDELCAVWGTLTAAVCHYNGEGGNGDRDDLLHDLVLKVFYYWVNFGPLSRGSAACGYIVLAGLMLALEWQLTQPFLPPGVQMDWEAILCSSPDAFLEKARPWLHGALRHCDDHLSSIPLVKDAFPTVLEAIKALNFPYAAS